MARTGVVIALFFLLAAGLASQDYSSILHEYAADVEAVKSLSGMARLVRFEKVSGIESISPSDTFFTLMAKDPPAEVRFASRRLSDLYRRLGSMDALSRITARATVYGVRTNSFIPRDAARRSAFEGRMIIAVHCPDEQCTGEEFLVFLSD